MLRFRMPRDESVAPSVPGTSRSPAWPGRASVRSSVSSPSSGLPIRAREADGVADEAEVGVGLGVVAEGEAEGG